MEDKGRAGSGLLVAIVKTITGTGTVNLSPVPCFALMSLDNLEICVMLKLRNFRED